MVPTVAVSVCPTCAVPVIVSVPVAGVLTTTAAATWKTAESPYMGRVLAFPSLMLLLLMGTVAATGASWADGDADRGFAPSPRDSVAKLLTASVPSCLQPVKGRLPFWEVSRTVGAGLVLFVGLVVPGPVVEILVLVGGPWRR